MTYVQSLTLLLTPHASYDYTSVTVHYWYVIIHMSYSCCQTALRSRTVRSLYCPRGTTPHVPHVCVRHRPFPTDSVTSTINACYYQLPSIGWRPMRVYEGTVLCHMYSHMHTHHDYAVTHHPPWYSHRQEFYMKSTCSFLESEFPLQGCRGKS